MKVSFPAKRIKFVAIVCVMMFAVVAGKLFYVQIINGVNLQAKALSQWNRDLPVTAKRGGIYDTQGILLAGVTTRYSVYVRPNALTDAAKTASLLSARLGLDYGKLLEKISRKGVSEITVAKKVEKEVMLEIQKENLDGIYFTRDTQRYYPYGDFMTQLLGFTNIDGEGQSGLERYYENYLKGVNGYILTESDLVGKELENGQTAFMPAINGFDLNTTLDFHVQAIVENVVDKAMAATNAKRISCLVMNPENGEVLALAESPSFDLNNLPRDDVAKLLTYSKNNMVSSVYEPGSTFKILTSAIALEENAFREDHSFFCPGYRTVDGQRIRCWRSVGHGSQDFAEGVCNSCNCVFMDCALAIGKETFYDYLEDFGLMAKTGVDVSGETSGLFLREEAVKNVDLARIGFGQAVAVTPIGLASAVATAVNGGNKITPHILKSITDFNGNTVYEYKISTEKSKISAETSEKLRDLLQNVVEIGSGKAAYQAGYSIGGKTGTAQKYVNGAIAQGKYVSSFVGYTFTEGVKAMVVFIVDEPVGPYYGSIVAAPYVGEIFKGIFDYKNVAPVYTQKDKEIIGEPFAMPDLRGLSVNEARNMLYSLGLYYEIDGEGDYVSAQLPAPGATVDKTVSVLISV